MCVSRLTISFHTFYVIGVVAFCVNWCLFHSRFWFIVSCGFAPCLFLFCFAPCLSTAFAFVFCMFLLGLSKKLHQGFITTHVKVDLYYYSYYDVTNATAILRRHAHGLDSCEKNLHCSRWLPCRVSLLKLTARKKRTVLCVDSPTVIQDFSLVCTCSASTAWKSRWTIRPTSQQL